MANVDGQIILGLNINATAANIQSGINQIIKNSKIQQIVLKAAIEKSETEKSVNDLVQRINKKTVKLGVEVNTKDVRNILSEQQKIASTQDTLNRQMREYRSIAKDVGITLNKSTWNTFNHAIKTQDFSKAKIIIKSAKTQIDDFNKSVKAMNSDTSISGSVSSIIKQFNKLNNVSDETRNRINLLKANMKQFETADSTKAKLGAYNRLKTTIELLKTELSQLQATEQAFGSFDNLNNRIDNLQNITKGNASLLANEGNEASTIVSNIDEIINRYSQLQTKIENLKSQGLLEDDPDFQKVINESQQLEKELANIERQTKAFGSYEAFSKFNKSITEAVSKTEELGTKWSAFKGNSTLNAQYDDLLSKSKNISSPKELAAYNAELAKFKANVKSAGLDTLSFGDKLKNAFKNFSYFFSASRMIYEVIEGIQKIIENVSELDSAMVELRKVTDASENELISFLENAEKRAVKLGTTVTDLVNATADFSRLGYSLKDSTTLGEVATIYANVGDDVESVDQATSSLISTMKGFNIEASNAETIIDKLNEVGNNFAISSGGIGDALQRSAAALSNAGNSIDESIGLIVAANNVIQDPETVGTMWKTVAMRIRGAKTELEEAGLETDYMAESTSKLRNTILGITNIDGGGGFDILTDTGAFKSTYDIILGIGEVWEKLGETDPIGQAALLELLAGKRQGNALAAALTNISDMTAAFETSVNSAGSAAQEYEVWLNSIEAKTQQFKASFEVLSSTLVSDNFIKNILDSGTDIISFIDKLINSMGGLTNTIALFSVAIMALNFGNTVKMFSSFWTSLKKGFGLFPKITSGIDSLKLAFMYAGEASGGATAKFKTFFSTLSGGAATMSIVTAAIMALVAVIGIAVMAYKNWQEKIEEQQQAAQESAQAYQESADSVDEYKDKITELRKEIDSGNLSEEEAYNKRQELISIQETLIEMFGEEAAGINLVTGEINKQIDAIDELSKKEWEAFNRENAEAIDRAVSSMTNNNSTVAFSTSKIKGYSKDGRTVENPEFYDAIATEYFNQIQNAVSGIKFTFPAYSSSANVVLPEFDNVYEAKEAYEELYDITDNYIKMLEKNGEETKAYENYLDSLRDKILDFKTTIKENEETFNAYAEGQLLYGEEYNKTWSKVLAAQKEYDEAVLSGDSQAIQDAVKKMNDAEAEFGKLKVDDEAVALYAEDYFEKFNAETKKHKATIELSTDDSEIKNLAQNAIKTFEDESGKVDLHSVLNVGTEYENLSDGAKRNKILTEEEQAYVELKYAANEYGVTVEDLLNILDDLGYIELDVAGATDDLGDSINGLSDAISTLDSMSDLGETMNSIIGSLKDGDGLQFGDLKSLSEQMTELGLSTDEYLEKLLDAGNSADEVQNVFAELTNELISQKVASGDLTEADEQMLAIWLESIGVANAASIAHNALAIDKDMVAEAETLLANATEGTISSVYEEIAAMMSEQGVTQATKQKLFELALQKLRVNENEIVTSSDIEQLIALADAAGATAASLENLAQAKAYYAEAERLDKLAESASTERGKGEAKSQANSYRQLAEQWANKPIEYEKINPDGFIITPTGNGSGGSSGSGKDANLDAWEKLVKQKKHLVETDQMTQEQYYDWLRSEYKSHLSDTEKYADELMSIEKELYDWEKQRIQASIDDELAVLDNQKAKGLISEEEYFKKLDELYSDGYSDLQQAVEEHNLYGVDNTERLQAETEFLEKVKDAHNSAYDAERQALDHKLAMNLISEEQYLIELQRLYDQYYKGQDMYSEEAMEIEEELYDKRVELVEKWAQAAVDAINEITEATEGMVDAIAQLIEDSIDTNEENFNLEKQLLDHALAMNYISEKDYYNSLEKLYKKYFKDKNLYMEQYWENQEAVYQYEQEALEDSASAIEDIHAKVVEMIKAEHEEAIEGIEETKNEYLDLIEIRRKALEEFKSDEDYEKERSDKLASIAELRRQLNALSYDTSAAGVAKYKEVYAQLKEAEEELADFERERSYDVMNKQLDNEESAIETKYDDEIAKHEDFLDNNEALVEEAWARLNDKNNDLYNQLIDYNKKYSTSIADDVTGSWEKATEALQRYSDAKAGYKDIVGNIGKSGMTDEEYSQFQKTTEGKQIYGWIKTALTFAGSMISVGAGLLSGFMGIAGSLMGGTGGSFLSMGSGVVGSVAGLASSVLGVLGGFATGTDYVSKTGWYRTDELGNEFKFVKDNQGNQYRFLTEGSKVVDAKTTDNFMKLVRSPDLFANTIKNQILSEIDATRSISNVVDSSSNDISVSPVFQISSSDPEGVVAEVRKLMPEIAKNTISAILSGTNKLGVKQKVQHLY